MKIQKAFVITIMASLLFLVSQSEAQIKDNSSGEIAVRSTLSGSLLYDLLPNGKFMKLASFQQIDQEIKDGAGKSPLKAALFSAVVPGAGQYYIDKYWSAVAFATAEIGLWIVYGVYESKGDRQTSEFEKYADNYWSVVLYAEWIERFGAKLNPGANIIQGSVISQDPNRPPWERIDWVKLNKNEEAIGQKSGTGFSHRLPRRPEQQYYEVIGKYAQYSSGWKDANVDDSNYLTNISPRFLFYRDMRGRANSFYSIASTAGSLLLANHVFSALHAAWQAANLNPDIDLEVRLIPTIHPYDIVEFVPTARLSIHF